MTKIKYIKTKWLNNTMIRVRDIEKPCHNCGYCPYGQLVEEFPLPPKRNRYSCKTFGHCCPCFFMSEDITE